MRTGVAEFLVSCPVPVCVVSNIDRADLDAAIRHTGLELPLSVTSEDARSYKPRPELFEVGLHQLGLQHHEVLHVGDSWSSDIVGATTLGIGVAWVSEPQRAVPDDAKIVHRCTDLRDLLPLIAGT